MIVSPLHPANLLGVAISLAIRAEATVNEQPPSASTDQGSIAKGLKKPLETRNA